MERVVVHPTYGEISYKESFWTGKRDISINGVKLLKHKRNVFLYNCGDTVLQVSVNGNVYTGIKLLMGGELVQILRSATWYEILCSISIFAFIVAWGSSPLLCSVFPVVGGAIGGAVSAGMAATNVLAMRSTESVLNKIAIWLCMLVGTILLCFLIAVAILYFFA